MVRYITKTRPIIEHGFSESCMNLSDPSVFPKNCSLDEENETKPELPWLLLLLYVPIILVTFYLFQKYKKKSPAPSLCAHNLGDLPHQFNSNQTLLTFHHWTHVCAHHQGDLPPGWQKLHGSTGGTRRKVWTRTKIFSPNMRYFVAN